MNSNIKEEKLLIAERLKSACADRTAYPMELLQRGGDFPKSSIYNWEAGGTSPKAEYLAHLQNLGIDVAYILTGQSSGVPHMARAKGSSLSGAAPAPACDVDTIHIAVMSATGSIGPGNELLTEDVIVGEAPFSRRWLSLNIPGVRPEALRLIHAYGDSMHGTLNSGDFAVVDTSCRTVEFPGVYLLHVNRLHFIKRVSFRMDGRMLVSSDNEAERTAEVLDGSHQLDVRGRVVYGWNGRRF